MRPAIHFILIGTALFLLQARFQARPPVTVPPGRLAELRDDFRQRTSTSPTLAEQRALMARELDDELLFREALARGLDRDDPTIRAHLIEKMRFLAPEPLDEDALLAQARALDLGREDAFVRRSLVERMRLLARRAIPDDAPDDATLQAHLERHADRWIRPGRTRITQVFFDRRRRGPTLERDAATVLAALRSDDPPAPHTVGDPLPIDGTAGGVAARDLAALFGPAIATRLTGGAPGVWTGPVHSAYGLHLVRVDAREPGGLPALADVRNQVEQAWRQERGEAAYAAFVAGLRRAHGLPAPGAGAG